MLQKKYFSAAKFAMGRLRSLQCESLQLAIFVIITTSTRKFASAIKLEGGKIRVRVREMVKGFGFVTNKTTGTKNWAISACIT